MWKYNDTNNSIDCADFPFVVDTHITFYDVASALVKTKRRKYLTTTSAKHFALKILTDIKRLAIIHFVNSYIEKVGIIHYNPITHYRLLSRSQYKLN